MASMPPQPSFQSNYPRGQAAGLAYTRPPGVYFDTIGTAVDMIRADWGVYAACSLIVFAVNAGLSMTLQALTVGFAPRGTFLEGLSPTLTIPAVLGQLAVQFISTFMIIGLVGVGVRHARGHWPSIPDLFLPFKRFGRTASAVGIMLVPYAVADLLMLILSPGAKGHPNLAVYFGFLGILGIIWLVLGGPLYLGAAAATFSDLPPLQGYIEAFKRVGWKAPLLSLLFALAGIVSGLGLVLCCFGLIFTLPIVMNVVALHYTYYFPLQVAVPAQTVE
jgi:hypothetical protein